MTLIEWKDILKVIKIPFILLAYVIYMLLTLFVPSKFVSKIINIEAIEKDLNSYFNDPFTLKMLALIVTIFIYMYVY